MRTLIFSTLIACLILGTVSLCPKHCQVCNTDPNICDVCQPGYLWNSYKLSCELDYHAQDEWGGVCNTGVRQSPINLKPLGSTLCPFGSKFVQEVNSLETTITPEQDEEALKTPYVDQSVVSFKINGVQKTFRSLQFHWHAPSEHQINGQNLDLELHIVHANTDGSGKLAVSGLLFKVEPLLLTDIFDKLNLIPDSLQHLFTFPWYLKNKLAYHYQGSLTTPPCSEIVDWFVYTEIFPISKKNFDRLRKAINEGHSNSRSVQGLNGRQPVIVGGFCNLSFI